MSKLRAMVEKATPEPWDEYMASGDYEGGHSYQDTALIVALRNIAPALVEFYEAATGDLDDDVRHMLAYGRLVDAIREATECAAATPTQKRKR